MNGHEHMSEVRTTFLAKQFSSKLIKLGEYMRDMESEEY